MEKQTRLTGFDLFMSLNFILLVSMATFVYYKGEAEFFLYAVVFILVGAFIWGRLRRHRIPWSILILLQVGILAHFAGGLVHIGGVRLYGHIFFNIRYDKYVHFYNSFAGLIGFNYLFNISSKSNRQMSRRGLMALVFGVGILIELIELSAYFFLPVTAVGDVYNNFFDLAANILGGLSAVTLIRYNPRIETVIMRSR